MMDYGGRLAALCLPCGPGGIGVLKPGAALAASVGISALTEGVRGGRRGAGFSSHFLCPGNRLGRKEAIPALAGEAALGLSPSFQVQPGLQIQESKLSPSLRSCLLGERFPVSFRDFLGIFRDS